MVQLAAGFQEIYQGVLMVDSKGYILACNKAAKELLGISGQVVGERVQEILPGLEMDDLLVTRIPANHKVVIGGRVLLTNHQPVFEGSKLTGVVSSFFDITELDAVAQASEITQELNKELEAIFNSSYDEIYVTDGEGYTLRVNKAGERFYGMKAEEMVGKHVSELEELGLFSPSITPQVLNSKKRTTIRQITKSGQEIIVTANPVFDESGKIIRVVTNSRDVTELNNLRQRLEDTEKLMDNYRMEIVKLRKEKIMTEEVVSQNATMQQIMILAGKVANVDSTVLIEGESGVGKGVVALKIHHLSKRRNSSFITINCGAIPENLMESELFGYEGGAFTGAKKEGKKGLFETANRGTIFLDEISELPLNLQVKLLHVIQDRRLRRVGGNEDIEVNVRIIAATNRNLPSLIKERKFREDLYYRLNVVPLVVPPLRHRKEDIPILINHFLKKFLDKYELHKKIAPETLELLLKYDWPGNVRELENLVERVVVTVDSVDVLPIHLPDYIVQVGGRMEKVFVLDICSLKNATEELERQLLNKALIKFHNTYKMADALEVNQSTVVRKMQRYGIF
ncbi:MAG: sigma 54-interacting transcriptional regulator [Desulfosporosinus sp.]|nr:sigma 54-interacting transcriptional regulator [Desulfosporosinus sp.]